jgi:hypothetical protein
MNNREAAKVSNTGHIMTVLYGILRGQELTGGVNYGQLVYDTCMCAHCTYQELLMACNEYVRSSKIVETYLIDRKELQGE